MPTNVFSTLRGYRASWLPGDLISGLMLAAIALPEQLATARLAGFPPEYGLYAFVAGSLAFAALGSNPYLSAGADSTIAPIFAGTLAGLAGAQNAHYAPLASLLAIAVGAVLVTAGLARAGWIADLLSVPVTVGILAGIAVHIVVGQLPALLGLTPSDGPLAERFAGLVQRAGAANGIDLAIGAGVLAIALAGSRANKRVPGALIGLIGAALASSMWPLQRHGVAMLATFTPHVPSFSFPQAPGAAEIAALAPLALVVAAVCMMQTAAVGRSFPVSTQSEDVPRDFLAVGAGGILAGLVGAFPVDSSPARTAIVKAAGGTSQLAALAAVAAVIGVMAFASAALAYVPQAALAGVLVYIAMHIFRLGDMVRIARSSRREFILLVSAALLVVLLPIQTGMLLAIILSLAHGIQLMMRPPSTELVRVPGTTIWWPAADEPGGERFPGVLVFAPAAPVNFTNAEYIRDRILAALAEAVPAPRLLIIEASGVTDFDYTGSQTLQRTIRTLRERRVDVAMARLIVTHAQDSAVRSGLIGVLGSDHVFKSVNEAVAALRSADPRPAREE